MKLARAWLYVEVLVCFAPVIGVLALGIAILPYWAGMIIFALISETYADSAEAIGRVALSMAIVLMGIAGLVGVWRCIGLMYKDASRTDARVTRWLMGIGAGGLVAFHLYGQSLGPEALSKNFWELLLLLVLPLACAVHLAYMARARLFRLSESSQRETLEP